MIAWNTEFYEKFPHYTSDACPFRNAKHGYEHANHIGRENEMKAPAFSYYMHDGPTGFSIELAGILDAEGAKNVEQDRPGHGAMVGKKELVLDLTVVTQIDPAGPRLLRSWLKNVPKIDFNQPVRLALWSQNGGSRVYSDARGLWMPTRLTSLKSAANAGPVGEAA